MTTRRCSHASMPKLTTRQCSWTILPKMATRVRSWANMPKLATRRRSHTITHQYVQISRLGPSWTILPKSATSEGSRANFVFHTMYVTPCMSHSVSHTLYVTCTLCIWAYWCVSAPWWSILAGWTHLNYYVTSYHIAVAKYPNYGTFCIWGTLQ